MSPMFSLVAARIRGSLRIRYWLSQANPAWKEFENASSVIADSVRAVSKCRKLAHGSSRSIRFFFVGFKGTPQVSRSLHADDVASEISTSGNHEQEVKIFPIGRI